MSSEHFADSRRSLWDRYSIVTLEGDTIDARATFSKQNTATKTSLCLGMLYFQRTPGVRFTTRCRALTAGLSLTLNLTTNSTIPVSQPLSCVSLSCANLSLSLTLQIYQWSSSIETTSPDHECKQEAAGA